MSSLVQHGRGPPHHRHLLCRDFEAGRAGWGDIDIGGRSFLCALGRQLARNKVCVGGGTAGGLGFYGLFLSRT